MDICVISLAGRHRQSIRVTSVRMHREDRSSVSSHPDRVLPSWTPTARRPPTSISRRSRDARAAAELLTGDEARRIAVKLRLQVSAHMPRAEIDLSRAGHKACIYLFASRRLLRVYRTTARQASSNKCRSSSTRSASTSLSRSSPTCGYRLCSQHLLQLGDVGGDAPGLVAGGGAVDIGSAQESGFLGALR
jgi:hypothetical protein